jgi:hypothetical protein
MADLIASTPLFIVATFKEVDGWCTIEIEQCVAIFYDSKLLIFYDSKLLPS